MPPGGATPGEALRVLVVDDNVDAAETLAELLDMGGYEVAVAHDGAQALSQVESFRPEVVLLDIGLPGSMDGYEVAARIRERLGESSPCSPPSRASVSTAIVFAVPPPASVTTSSNPSTSTSCWPSSGRCVPREAARPERGPCGPTQHTPPGRVIH